MEFNANASSATQIRSVLAAIADCPNIAHRIACASDKK
jgi:hypothetical protein